MNEIGEKFEKDSWDEKTYKKVFVGRPSLGAGETKTMTFKIPASTLFQVETKATSLGVSRSQYVRDLINRDLMIA